MITEPMTEERLKEIQARAAVAYNLVGGKADEARRLMTDDVPDLVAEVRRLRLRMQVFIVDLAACDDMADVGEIAGDILPDIGISGALPRRDSGLARIAEFIRSSN